MLTANPPRVSVYAGPDIAAYAFGETHPFGPDRHGVFMDALAAEGLSERVRIESTHVASEEQLALFHTPRHIARVRQLSRSGSGYFDGGDTPAVAGIFAAASAVVGTTLAAVDALMAGDCDRAFVPIAGLHHAGRDQAAGFCVFNDCGVAIEHLLRKHELERVAYVDIDAHHGDGVFYAFEDSAEVYFADVHEDGRYLYPGTGAASETGRGRGAGCKLNIPMAPGAGDRDFFSAWEQVESFVEAAQPQFIILQCGADSLAGDPLTHLAYSSACHAHAAARLVALAEKCGHGRVLALGGGGYNRSNLARAWCAVVAAFLYRSG